MKTLPRLCIAAAFCWFLATGAQAQDDYYTRKPVPLDKEQQAIVEQVIDEIIAAIKPLKAAHPGLEHFGEKPWFTRAPGEFRYDYKITKGKPVEDGSGSAVALPGGCGMYFELAPSFTPFSKWSRYYRGYSFGGDRAGICHDLSITTDDPKHGFDGVVYAAVQGVLDTTFEKLAAEYVLRKHNVKQDTASVIAALASDDQDVRYSAVRELTTRKLAPGDFAAIRDGYAKEKFPATFGFFYMVKFLQAHDDANLPDFCLAMAKLEIRIETEGRGIVKPTPFVTGPESEADVATLCLLGIFAKRDEKNADPRFVPAALEILNTDPNEGHREQALDYFSKLTGEPRAQGIAAGLENSERSIQIKAAQLAGGLKVAGVGKPLVALLASPSAAVRAAAREAAKKLALDVPAADPERPAPAALAHIADTLWQCGLDEDEVVAGCGPVPEKVSNVFPTAPPQSAMPAEIKVVIPRKGDPRNFSLILTDPWRMTKMDADSVKKRGAQFAAGFSRGGQPDSIHGGPIDATGPYLIAAAMKLGDTATAQAVYERLCDRFTTDDGILYEGLQGLGWSRILTALDLYTHAKDDEALKAFARVIQLENHVRPRSFLAGYVKLAHQVTTDIERRKKEAPAPAPEFATGVECEAYWHEKFPDKKARIEAMVAQLQNGVTSAGWDHTRGESSLNIALEDEGSDAVEPLLDCLVHNDWLTRDVQEDWDHGEPVRWVTGVRGGIIDLLDKMYHKRFVTIENQAGFSEGDPATLQKIAEAVRAARDAEVKSESGK